MDDIEPHEDDMEGFEFEIEENVAHFVDAGFLKLEHEKASLCIIYPGTDGLFEVDLGNDSHRVNMKRRTCTCRKWDITGIPCEHSYGVILDQSLDPDDFVSDWFLTSRWRDTYASSIIPLRGARFWVRGSSLLVSEPPEPLQTGRKKKKKKKQRIKGVNESPSKKKKPSNKRVQESPLKNMLKLSKRTMHCKKCGQAGHNSRSCEKKTGHALQMEDSQSQPMQMEE